MGGIRNICKIHGGLKVTIDGKTVEYVWDYIKDEPRLKSDMTKEELEANERFKFGLPAKRERKPKQTPDAENGELF